MEASEPKFVLAAGTEIVRVGDLPAATQLALQASVDDCVIGRRGSRHHSLLLERDAAKFVETFASPTTIVEAVLRFSPAIDANPEDALEKLYPVLGRLRAASFLVEADDSDSTVAGTPHPRVTAGSSLLGFEILRTVQSLDDSEVYQARDAAGQLVALKIFKTSRNSASLHLARELRILQRLAGILAPKLIRHELSDGHYIVVTEWLSGEHAGLVASRLRRSPDRSLGTLCLAVADAYAELHENGVLHGDVHPRNIIIGEDLAVRLLDFEYGSDDNNKITNRGVVPYFMNPELAGSMLSGESFEALTPAAEQYCVAAVIYYLLTGRHVVEFKLQREMFLSQVLEEPPDAFRTDDSGREFEPVLRRALEKEQTRRYSSQREFAEALRAAASRNTAAGSKYAPLESFVRSMVKSYADDPAARAAALRPPKASVAFGAAGIAYFLYRMACIRGEPEMLALALHWITAARRESAGQESFHNPSLELTSQNVAPCSLYHGPFGVDVVECLIALAGNQLELAGRSVARLVRFEIARLAWFDVFLGGAGALLGVSTLLEACQGRSDAVELQLRQYGQGIYDVLLAGIRDRSGEVTYLGAAHGWAGLLYSMLRWRRAVDGRVEEDVARHVAGLAALGSRTSQRVCWPRRRGDPYDDPPWRGWCHGAAGYVHLWLAAYESTNDEQFLELARGAAVEASDQPTAGATLCCGAPGQAFAMLAMQRVTGEVGYGEIAERLALESMRDARGLSYPDSLYKGALGVALLGAEVAHKEVAAMPLFAHE